MKRVIIKDLEGKVTHRADLENPEQWIKDRIADNSWGFPERDIEASIATDEDKKSSLLDKLVEHPDGTVTHYYRLPATYTVSVIELDLDPEYALEQVREQRRREYEARQHDSRILDALYWKEKGVLGPWEQLVAERDEIKTMYPKPPSE